VKQWVKLFVSVCFCWNKINGTGVAMLSGMGPCWAKPVVPNHSPEECAMKTVVECGHCQVKFKIVLNTVPDTGRSGGCPNCGKSLLVSNPDEATLQTCDHVNVDTKKVSKNDLTRPLINLPVMNPESSQESRSKRELRRMVRWSVVLATGLLLALAVTGGRQYFGLRQSLVQVQGRLVEKSKFVEVERERFKILEQRYVQLRQEQAQRHLSEIRRVVARGARLLEEERNSHAWDVQILKDEKLKLLAQVRQLREKNAALVSRKGSSNGCIDGDCENGRGTYLARNGDKYIGGWKRGKRHGKGVIYTANGDLYAGQWLFGQRLGGGGWRLKIADFMEDPAYAVDQEKERLKRALEGIAEEKVRLQRKRFTDQSSG